MLTEYFLRLISMGELLSCNVKYMDLPTRIYNCILLYEKITDKVHHTDKKNLKIHP